MNADDGPKTDAIIDSFATPSSGRSSRNSPEVYYDASSKLLFKDNENDLFDGSLQFIEPKRSEKGDIHSSTTTCKSSSNEERNKNEEGSSKLQPPKTSYKPSPETQRFLDLLDLASGNKPANGYSVLKDRIYSLTKRSTRSRFQSTHGGHFGGLGVRNVVKKVETKNKEAKRDIFMEKCPSSVNYFKTQPSHIKQKNIKNFPTNKTYPHSIVYEPKKEESEVNKPSRSRLKNAALALIQKMKKSGRDAYLDNASKKAFMDKLILMQSSILGDYFQTADGPRTPTIFKGRGTFVVTGSRGMKYDLSDPELSFEDIFKTLDFGENRSNANETSSDFSKYSSSKFKRMIQKHFWGRLKPNKLNTDTRTKAFDFCEPLDLVVNNSNAIVENESCSKIDQFNFPQLFHSTKESNAAFCLPQKIEHEADFAIKHIKPDIKNEVIFSLNSGDSYTEKQEQTLFFSTHTKELPFVTALSTGTTTTSYVSTSSINPFYSSNPKFNDKKLNDDQDEKLFVTNMKFNFSQPTQQEDRCATRAYHLKTTSSQRQQKRLNSANKEITFKDLEWPTSDSDSKNVSKSKLREVTQTDRLIDNNNFLFSRVTKLPRTPISFEHSNVTKDPFRYAQKSSEPLKMFPELSDHMFGTRASDIKKSTHPETLQSKYSDNINKIVGINKGEGGASNRVSLNSLPPANLDNKANLNSTASFYPQTNHKMIDSPSYDPIPNRKRNTNYLSNKKVLNQFNGHKEPILESEEQMKEVVEQIGVNEKCFVRNEEKNPGERGRLQKYEQKKIQIQGMEKDFFNGKIGNLSHKEELTAKRSISKLKEEEIYYSKNITIPENLAYCRKANENIIIPVVSVTSNSITDCNPTSLSSFSELQVKNGLNFVTEKEDSLQHKQIGGQTYFESSATYSDSGFLLSKPKSQDNKETIIHSNAHLNQNGLEDCNKIIDEENLKFDPDIISTKLLNAKEESNIRDRNIPLDNNVNKTKLMSHNNEMTSDYTSSTFESTTNEVPEIKHENSQAIDNHILKPKNSSNKVQNLLTEFYSLMSDASVKTSLEEPGEKQEVQYRYKTPFVKSKLETLRNSNPYVKDFLTPNELYKKKFLKEKDTASREPILRPRSMAVTKSELDEVPKVLEKDIKKESRHIIISSESEPKDFDPNLIDGNIETSKDNTKDDDLPYEISDNLNENVTISHINDSHELSVGEKLKYIQTNKQDIADDSVKKQLLPKNKHNQEVDESPGSKDPLFIKPGKFKNKFTLPFQGGLLQSKANDYLKAVQKSQGIKVTNDMQLLKRKKREDVVTENKPAVIENSSQEIMKRKKVFRGNCFRNPVTEVKLPQEQKIDTFKEETKAQVKNNDTIDTIPNNNKNNSEEVLIIQKVENASNEENKSKNENISFSAEPIPDLEPELNKKQLKKQRSDDSFLNESNKIREEQQRIYRQLKNKELIKEVNRNDAKKVKILLDEGADPNAFYKHDSSNTILHKAVSRGFTQVVRELLRAGANVEAKTDLKNSALHLAAKEGHDEIVRELILHQADVNVLTIYGITPLQYSLSMGHTVINKVFLQNSAKTDLPNIIGESANDLARTLGYTENINDKEFQTNEEVPLNVQLIKGIELECPITVEKCLENGASPDTRVPLALHWPANATVLHRAAYKGDDVSVQLLLRAGSSINVRDVVMNTPLHAAAQKGDIRVIGLLVNAGSDLEARSQKGMTPLHRAASKGNEFAVKALLKFGANKSSVDECGRTPADWAVKGAFYKLASNLQVTNTNSPVYHMDGQKHNILNDLINTYALSTTSTDNTISDSGHEW